MPWGPLKYIQAGNVVCLTTHGLAAGAISWPEYAIIQWNLFNKWTQFTLSLSQRVLVYK